MATLAQKKRRDAEKQVGLPKIEIKKTKKKTKKSKKSKKDSEK